MNLLACLLAFPWLLREKTAVEVIEYAGVLSSLLGSGKFFFFPFILSRWFAGVGFFPFSGFDLPLGGCGEMVWEGEERRGEERLRHKILTPIIFFFFPWQWVRWWGLIYGKNGGGGEGRDEENVLDELRGGIWVRG